MPATASHSRVECETGNFPSECLSKNCCSPLTSLDARVNIVHRLFEPRRHFYVLLHELWDDAFYNYIAPDEATGILYF